MLSVLVYKNPLARPRQGNHTKAIGAQLSLSFHIACFSSLPDRPSPDDKPSRCAVFRPASLASPSLLVLFLSLHSYRSHNYNIIYPPNTVRKLIA